MTGPEIDDWLETLATTDNKRIEALHELLRNAGEDGMVEEDRVVCVNALRMLHRKQELRVAARRNHVGT